MFVTIQNHLLSDVAAALGKVADERLPAKLAIAVVKNARAVEEAAKDVEETRLRLIREHAQTDENGEIVMDGDAPVFDDRAHAEREIVGLLSDTSEVRIKKVPYDVWPDGLQPKLLYQLAFMFEDEEDEEVVS